MTTWRDTTQRTVQQADVLPISEPSGGATTKYYATAGDLASLAVFVSAWANRWTASAGYRRVQRFTDAPIVIVDDGSELHHWFGDIYYPVRSGGTKYDVTDLDTWYNQQSMTATAGNGSIYGVATSGVNNASTYYTTLTNALDTTGDTLEMSAYIRALVNDSDTSDAFTRVGLFAGQSSDNHFFQFLYTYNNSTKLGYAEAFKWNNATSYVSAPLAATASLISNVRRGMFLTLEVEKVASGYDITFKIAESGNGTQVTALTLTSDTHLSALDRIGITSCSLAASNVYDVHGFDAKTVEV